MKVREIVHRSRNIDGTNDRDEARSQETEACGNEVTKYTRLETKLPIQNMIYRLTCNFVISQ